MLIKKNFSILDLEEEALYLNEMANKGMMFIRSRGDGHEFKEIEPTNIEFRVEYTIDPLDDAQMFELVDAYHSSKGGYYSYLIRVGEGEFVSNTDREDVVMMQRNRVDRFTGIVLGGLVILFTYMYIDQREPLYLWGIAAVLGMSSYVLYNRRKMNKIVKISK